MWSTNAVRSIEYAQIEKSNVTIWMLKPQAQIGRACQVVTVVWLAGWCGGGPAAAAVGGR